MQTQKVPNEDFNCMLDEAEERWRAAFYDPECLRDTSFGVNGTVVNCSLNTLCMPHVTGIEFERLRPIFNRAIDGEDENYSAHLHKMVEQDRRTRTKQTELLNNNFKVCRQKEK